MWPEFVRAVLESRPDVFVAENVAALKGVGTALLTSATVQDAGVAFTIRADLSPALVSHLYTAN